MFQSAVKPASVAAAESPYFPLRTPQASANDPLLVDRRRTHFVLVEAAADVVDFDVDWSARHVQSELVSAQHWYMDIRYLTAPFAAVLALCGLALTIYGFAVITETLWPLSPYFLVVLAVAVLDVAVVLPLRRPRLLEFWTFFVLALAIAEATLVTAWRFMYPSIFAHHHTFFWLMFAVLLLLAIVGIGEFIAYCNFTRGAFAHSAQANLGADIAALTDSALRAQTAGDTSVRTGAAAFEFAHLAATIDVWDAKRQ